MREGRCHALIHLKGRSSCACRAPNLVRISVAIAAAVAASSLPALAIPAHASPGFTPEVINLDISADGSFTMPQTVRAGFVTFRVTTSGPVTHGIQGFRTKNGATPQDVLHDFFLGVGTGVPSDATEGHRLLLQDSVLIGGVVTTPITPISVTVKLEPGTYYFFDINEIFIPITPRLHTLEAIGPFHGSTLPSVEAMIQAVMDGPNPIFRAPSSMSANGTFMLTVHHEEIHEILFRPTRPGITNECVGQFYDAVRERTPRPPTPFTGPSFGLQAMSPHRWAILHFDLPAATYTLVCNVPGLVTGRAHVLFHMHKVLQMT